MMLTARGDVTDRMVGLELGADDSLPKPFEPRELVARLRAVLRRSDTVANAASELLRSGVLELNWTMRRATMDRRDLQLTTAELLLPAMLMRNRGRVLSRDRILERLRHLLRPVRDLGEGVAPLSEGRFEPLTVARRRDEFGALTAAFNQMVERLRQMISARDPLLMDVSHELRYAAHADKGRNRADPRR